MENFLPLPSDISTGCSFTPLTSVCGGDSNNCVPAEACVPPLITTESLDTMTIGEPFEFVLTASGSLPRTWSIYTGELPAGLTLDSETGTISGTPTVQDVYNIYLLVENACGSATQYLNGEIEVVTQPRVKWGLLYPDYDDPNNFSGQFFFNSPPSLDNKLQEEGRNDLLRVGGFPFETFDTLTPFVGNLSSSPSLGFASSGWTRTTNVTAASYNTPKYLLTGISISCFFTTREQMKIENTSAGADTFTMSRTGTMTVTGITGVTSVTNTTATYTVALTAYDGVTDYGGILGNSGSGATFNNINSPGDTTVTAITPASAAWVQLLAGLVTLSCATTEGPIVVSPAVSTDTLFSGVSRATITLDISYRRWAGYFWMMIPVDWQLPAAVGGFKRASDNSNIVMASMADGFGTSEENGCGYEDGYEFPFFSPDYKIVRSLDPFYGGDVDEVVIVP